MTHDKGYPFCADCANRGNETGDCDACFDGSNYETVDDVEQLTVHDLKFIRFKEES